MSEHVESAKDAVGRDPWEGIELLRAIRNQPSVAQPQLPDLARSVTKSDGSDNLPLLLGAVALYRNVPGAPRRWSEFFEASRSAWMGQEVGSAIYGVWHALAVLAVEAWAYSHRAPTLAQQASEWLLHWWCWCLATRTRDGRILSPPVGMRSGGHEPAKKSPREVMLALGLREPSRPWEGALRPPLSWEIHGYRLLIHSILRTAYPLLRRADNDGRSPDWRDAIALRPPYRTVAPLNVYRTNGGLAVWFSTNHNGHTTPILGAVDTYSDVGGRVRWLPPSGGVRVREKFERATCTRDSNALVYTGEYNGTHTLPLPLGTPIFDGQLGADSADGGDR